jgi:hypothetical protein
MGIKSTQDITRAECERRIHEIIARKLASLSVLSNKELGYVLEKLLDEEGPNFDNFNVLDEIPSQEPPTS